MSMDGTWGHYSSVDMTRAKKFGNEKKVNSPEILTKPELLTVLAKYFKSKIFLVDDYTFTTFPTRNIFNYKDEYLKLEVLINKERDSDKTHTFFVKKLPSEPTGTYERTKKSRAFFREIEVYTTMFYDIEKAQKESMSNEPWHPICYFAKPGQVLVLEDLVTKGFYQVGRRDCLEREQLLAAIKSLAAFHTASIKLEERANAEMLKPKRAEGCVTIADLYPHLRFEPDSVKMKGHPDNVFFETGVQALVNLVDYLPGYSRLEMMEIKSKLPSLLRKTTDMAEPSKKYHNVFVHGDVCASNILFRGNESGLESIIVDYQTVRYAPPAMDLMMLLFVNQRRDARNKDMQNMIRFYYNTLSEELTKSNMCIQPVLPVKDFLESCEEYAEWARLYNPLYLQTYLLSEEIVAKHLDDPRSFIENMLVDRSEMIAECYSKDELYRTRMTEAMNELIKDNIISR